MRQQSALYESYRPDLGELNDSSLRNGSRDISKNVGALGSWRRSGGMFPSDLADGVLLRCSSGAKPFGSYA